MTTLRPANLFRPLALLVLPLAAGGCVHRTLEVESNPPGALVYLNGEEVGRTPMRKEFLWYGTYDVQLRKEGYETLSAEEKVWAPWWQWPPFDLFAELFPVTDRKQLSYQLSPMTETQEDPAEMVARGEKMRGELRSSKHTTVRTPASALATQPAQ